MEAKLDLIVHGRGNAWPVPLGEEHPFYDRKDPRDLANASFSLQLRDQKNLLSSVLIDAGHGTVQSMLSNDNCIPDCICLTHGHLDHTLSVDWVVQSFWRRHRNEKPYPIYSTLPVYRFLVQSFPHLEELTEHRELAFGKAVAPLNELPLELTPYPAYHGQSAVGASMLLFEYRGRKILFTGDLLAPLLRAEDYERLNGIDMLVVDTNNRFPWPRTNHWSFAASAANPRMRSKTLEAFAGELKWTQAATPQLQEGISAVNRNYLSQLEREWDPDDLPLTVLEFMERIRPGQVMPVHYSGAEDRKYNGEEILSTKELQDWASDTARKAGISGEIMVPVSGSRIQISQDGQR
jgi:glyoxylase-like metal-dependent hydrolase (beta-lactamase superfamily II)